MTIYKSNLTDVWDLGDVSELKVPKYVHKPQQQII